MEVIYKGVTFQGAHKFEATVNGKFAKMQYIGYSYNVARRLFREYLQNL